MPVLSPKNTGNVGEIQWRSQGFDPGGMIMFLGGAIFILDSGEEPAKWATEARSPSIGLSE